VVPHAGGAQVVARAAALLLAGLTLTGCLGSDSGSGDQPAPRSGARIGEVRLADCDDWTQANVRERFGTVRDLREFAGSQVPSSSGGGRGATLGDREAYDYFERYCKQRFARRFKLYKLYTRAAAFRRR
jgi:hypothetical protein